VLGKGSSCDPRKALEGEITIEGLNEEANALFNADEEYYTALTQWREVRTNHTPTDALDRSKATKP
jgi:hypothetical protein